MSQPKRIAHADLEQFFLDALAAVGVPEHVAAVEAQIGAEVDLHGGHTHGVALLPAVVDYIRRGVLQAEPQFQTLVDYPASLLVDAGGAIGRFASAQGMDWALERAQQYGVGTCVVRGVGHWGRGHSYALRAARAGLVGLAFTNAFANFPAWGTRVPSLGNNPLAIGIPSADGEPAVLDLAMTQTSIGRVRQAATAGRAIPEGWGLDQEGQPTTDPNTLIDSFRFLPMGQHKGSGLAFMVDLLTAGLAGGLLAYEQGTEGRPTDSAGGSSKCFIALKPFGDWLPERSDDLKSHLKNVEAAPEQGPVQWPGEGSYQRRRDYLQDGITLEAALAAQVDQLAADLSLSVRWA
ncbi:MAG: hypothetical protein GKR89_09960 [Candidatus Latescibacteria bacterium]|nr:hypothetical protein [Candidatus Latescibacterota bacterium]